MSKEEKLRVFIQINTSNEDCELHSIDSSDYGNLKFIGKSVETV